MGIQLVEKAIKQQGSQVKVAAKLGISPQRLNNWLRAKAVPKAWEWGLEKRLGLK
jgi:transposase-like protein